MYHAQELIGKAFDEHGIKYKHNNDEVITAGFSVTNGPDVRVRFISSDDDNDVAVRVFGLIHTSPLNYFDMLDAINKVNHKFRYLRFILDTDGDVNIEYDVPQETCDECLGEVCFEMFIRFMHVIDEAYPILMAPLFGQSSVEEMIAADEE